MQYVQKNSDYTRILIIMKKKLHQRLENKIKYIKLFIKQLIIIIIIKIPSNQVIFVLDFFLPKHALVFVVLDIIGKTKQKGIHINKFSYYKFMKTVVELNKWLKNKNSCETKPQDGLKHSSK